MLPLLVLSLIFRDESLSSTLWLQWYLHFVLGYIAIALEPPYSYTPHRPDNRCVCRRLHPQAILPLLKEELWHHWVR